MSAIAGIWHFDQKPGGPEKCAQMLSAQRMYGPDRGAQWSDEHLAVGHRQHRVLPEDAFDLQPLRSRDGRYVLVADLRLDNRSDLITALDLRIGSTVRLSDAALLLECLVRWGESAINRLVGDFAFALWDSISECLTMARDYLGQRPLYYHQGKAFFAFSSMPKGLHALPEIPYAPDEQSIAGFLTRIPIGPRSYFDRVTRVMAGHVVTIRREHTACSRRYWEPQEVASSHVSASDYAEGLRHHLDQATVSRLRGVSGLVGAHLSSGFDSGAVAATAAMQLGNGGGVIAFTSVPRRDFTGPVPLGSLGDEGPMAAVVAAMYTNIQHVLVPGNSLSPLHNLDQTFDAFQRPITSLCNWVWLRQLNDAAETRGIKILLTADMGNLSLSYHGLESLPEHLRGLRLVKLFRAKATLQMSTRGFVSRTFGPFIPAMLWRLADEASRGYSRSVSEATAIRLNRLSGLNLNALAAERGLDLTRRPWSNGFVARLWAMRSFEIGDYHKGILATWGIDQRDPTSDKRLVEYSLSIPTEHFMADGRPRALARRALADRMPKSALAATTRGLQAADWFEGLTLARPDLVTELTRQEGVASAAALLDLPRLKRLVNNWPTSGWDKAKTIQTYRKMLLRSVSAGHFLRMLDGGIR